MKIEDLIQEEYDKATAKYGAFNSTHEGYSVLLEEYDEFMDELPYIKRDIDDIWYNTKHNINEPKYASFLYKDSLKAIIELIQVAAMAKRFLHDVYGEDI